MPRLNSSSELRKLRAVAHEAGVELATVEAHASGAAVPPRCVAAIRAALNRLEGARRARRAARGEGRGCAAGPRGTGNRHRREGAMR